MKAKGTLKIILLVSLAVMLGMSGCNLPPYGTGAVGPGDIYTQAAKTIVADMTRSVGETAVSMLTQIAQGTPLPTQMASVFPTITFLPSTGTSVPPTVTAILPTWTPLPTMTPTFTPTWMTPTSTPVPPTATRVPPTPTSGPCDWAQFVVDVTTPDGTTVLPATLFTKIWRLKNIGSCTWAESYELVFFSGDAMGEQSPISLPKVVRPGETVDVAAELAGPGQVGHYRGYWMLRNAYKELFGIGENASKAFWVDIKVVMPVSPYSYDFVYHVCEAAWRSSAGALPCPGDKSSANGSVLVLADPWLENNRHENEPALWTRPHTTSGGWIQGTYPSYKVQAGDHFMADTGCLLDSQGCDITFFLSYQVPGKPVHDLSSWRQVYDGKLTRADIDLTPLTGKTVQLILSVVNNGKASKANAFWLGASIRWMAVPPTYTPTSTATLTRTYTPTPIFTFTPTPTNIWESMPAVQAAKQVIAQAAGVSASQVAVTYVVAVQWVDTCLGIYPPGKVCPPALIPGYRILLEVNIRHFEAHTNQDGSTVFWFEY